MGNWGRFRAIEVVPHVAFVFLRQHSFLSMGAGRAALCLLLALQTTASLAKVPATCPAKASNGAIALQDGRVLLASLEHSCVYDPATSSWSQPIPQKTLRMNGRMARLFDGSVILMGGHNLRLAILSYEAVSTCERFFPAAQVWQTSGELPDAKDFVEGHSVVTLDDGNVVAVSSDTKFFNPTMGVWLSTSHLAPFNGYQAVVALPGRRVYALGGRVEQTLANDVIIYDGPPTTPSQKTWLLQADSALGLNPNLDADIRSGPNQAGIAHLLRAQLLQSDSLLIRWEPGPRLKQQHGWPAATLLQDGSILITGGYYASRDEDTVVQKNERRFVSTRPARTAERLYPDSGRVEQLAPMQKARMAHSLVLLPSGRVLALGGQTNVVGSDLTRTVEEYDPVRNTWRLLPPLKHDHLQPSAVVLPNGSILIASPTSQPELYRPPTQF